MPNTKEFMKTIARAGGLKVSSNKEHMAAIGRKGGLSVSKNKEHMSSIGKKGGAHVRNRRYAVNRLTGERDYVDFNVTERDSSGETESPIPDGDPGN